MVSVKKNDLKKQIEDLTYRWKRALADYQNLEKRYEKEKEDFVQFANANLILKLVKVLENLQKAAEHLKDPGLNLVIGELKRVLGEEGVEEIKLTGEKFDPNLMEAVEVVLGKEENKVAEVVSKGYLLKGKVLLPAKVKVFQTKKPDQKAERLAKEQLVKGNYM